jgi:hypothetical protein
MGGVVLSESVTTRSDAVLIRTGTGTLTVQSTKTLSTTGQVLTITADDMDIVDGGISSGAASMNIMVNTASLQTSIGNTAVGLHLTDTEFGRLSTSSGVFIGSADSGDIVVSAVTDSNSDTMNLVTLLATKASRAVTFESPPSSFNKGIVVQSTSGIVFNDGLTTKNSATYLNGGTGSLTIAASRSLSSTNQLLTVTTDDVDISSSATVDTGTGTLLLTTTSSLTMGVGTTTQQYDLESSEFGAFETGGLIIGSAGINKGMQVVGVLNADSQDVVGIVTLLTTVDDQKIVFNTTSSTFHHVAAQADNGVVVTVDITATMGAIYLDGDYDNSSSEDGDNKLTFSADSVLTAKTYLTLESTTGNLVRNGRMTLSAGRGIVIHDNFVGGREGEALVIYAGYDLQADGDFALSAGKTIDTGGQVLITAMDVNIQGGLATNQSAVVIHTSGSGRTIGVGASAQQMHVDASEISRMTSSGLSIGGGDSGSITVGGVSSTESSKITGLVSFNAISDDAKIIFSAQQSLFSAVAAIADNGIEVGSNMLTLTGDLLMNGDADQSSVGDDNNQISVSGDRVLEAAGRLTLDATSGGIVRAGTGVLQLNGGEGVVINDDVVSQTAGQQLTINSDTNNDGQGTFTVKSGRTVDSNNGLVLITAADVDLSFINSGAAPTVVTVSQQGLKIGLGATSKDLWLSGPELQKVTATGMVIGSDRNADVEIDGIQQAESAAITGMVTVVANAAGRFITFTATRSTFNGLAAQAGNGVNVNSGITTVVGNAVIDGDSDKTQTGNFADRITVASEMTLTAANTLILDSLSGGITHVGRMTLNGREGVIINDNMSGQQIERGLQINADYDSNGVGAFTLKNGITVDSSNSFIRITAADIDVLGALTSGTQEISMHASGTDRTIGIGSTVRDMHLADSELGQISTTGLAIGNQHNGDMVIDGIQDASTTTIGVLSFVATKEDRTVEFSNNPSNFNKGITVQAMGGVRLLTAFTSKNSVTTFRAGTGTFTVAASRTVLTTNQNLVITADDIDLKNLAGFDAGTGVVTITTESAKTIGVGGSGTEQMNIELAEMTNIVASGLTVGRSGSLNKSIKVQGVPAAASSGISDFVSLIAAVDDSRITFTGVASTFSALGAQADNGITVDTTIIATSGYMHLNGDFDESNRGDDDNSIAFTDGLTIQAKTTLTLESATGSLLPGASLTLRAGSGINIFNDVTASVASNLVFDADYESAGDGMLTIATAKSLNSNSGSVTVTAADVDFGGSVSANFLTVHTATPGGTMSLGILNMNLTVSSDELQNVVSSNFELGSNVNGDITISGVTERSSNSVTGVVSIVALRDDARVSFTSTASTFNAMAVLADNGIVIESDLITDTGILFLNGDADSASADDSPNAIQFGGERTMRGTGLLTIVAASTGIRKTAAGTTTLRSGTGITIDASMASDVAGQTLILNADDLGGIWRPADTSGIGVLTVAANRVLDTGSGQILVTASDIDLQGSLNAGNSSLLFTVSREGAIVGVGATTNTADGFTLSGGEIQRLTCTGLTIGSIQNSSIEVDGVTRADSLNVHGVVSLVATKQSAAISFTTAGSTFSAISAVADDGIDVLYSVSTTVGSITLNGDADDTDDNKSRDFIYFGTGLRIESALDINLSATTGGIKLVGPVQMVANRHINIDNAFNGPFGSHVVTVTADADQDGVGVASVASAACSIYSNAASCVASRLCGWCGSEAKTVGMGVVTSFGGAGLSVNGTSSFASDASITADNLITVNGQSRKIVAITGDMSATIESKFTKTPTGVLSVYEGALDQVVGSTVTRFDQELRAGYSVTINGISQTVSSVESYKSFTLATSSSFSASNALYTIGNIQGSGVVSTDSGLSVTVTGSWPPAQTRFLTELKSGSYITVGSETRIVDTIVNNQLLTVTTPFSTSFKTNSYNISNIAGTGSLSVTSGSSQVSGSDLTPTAFVTEIKVGDIISVIINSLVQTKMVQTITDDQHLSVSSVFSSTLSNTNFEVGNVHNSPFTISKKATGTVTSNGFTLTGLATNFGFELENGFNIVVKSGGTYVKRRVQQIQHDSSLLMSAVLPSEVAGVEFHYETCPVQTAAVDDDAYGTFSLHSKAVRPGVCYNTGRCVPIAAQSPTFTAQGTGTIAGSSLSTSIAGIGTNFLTDLQNGYSISIFTATQVESRKVASVISNTQVTLDHPFSFDIQPASNQQFSIHFLSGRGTLTNAGGSNYTVYGTDTLFVRDFEVGFVIGVGNERRLITSISSNTEMTVNAPFNFLNGGVAGTDYAYEACAGDSISATKELTLDYAPLDPGCCGFKAVGAVAGGDFAYFRVVPPSTNYNLRVVATAAVPQLEVYMRYTYAPDASNYDFKAVSSYSPWQIELPQNRLRCPTNTSSCDSLWVGVKGLAAGGSNIAFEVASYLEFNFPSFACSESSEATLSAKCQSLGLRQMGDALFTPDATDANNANVMRLTSEASSQKGAVWYGTKLHLENGFETSFTFKTTSQCSQNPTTGCGAADGFAFVMHGNTQSDVIGCGGKALGFASDSAANCEGIQNSFAVEFDTWHNPELRDINIRGSGTVEVNATTVARYNYNHAAFFSNGASANTNSHDTQLAGTPAIPAINDGNWHTVRVVYIPGTSSASPGRLFLYIDDMQSFVLTAPIRFTRTGSCGIASTDRCVLDVFGNAWVGFTAATGEVGQSHDISKWLHCEEPGCGRS